MLLLVYIENILSEFSLLSKYKKNRFITTT